jgi:uncharacterized membrane protein (UPF0136 family)
MNSSSACKPELTTRAIVVFASLQALDVITTLLGWRLGAQEMNFVVAHFMHIGPAQGLIIAKIVGFLLVVAVFVRRKARLVRLLNIWFAGIVTWNLVMIWMQWWAGRRP